MNYGKGKVICTGFSLTGVTEEKVVKKILEKSLHNREAHSDDAGVRIFPWKGQNGFLYLAVLNRSGNWRSASVTLAGAGSRRLMTLKQESGSITRNLKSTCRCFPPEVA